MARECQRCLYSDDHPLGLVIDKEGICSGCRVHEEKDTLDWNQRWLELEQVVRPYRSLSGLSYDCVVPVSGSAESFYLLHIVKNKLQLNPITVTYNSHFNSSVGMRNLAKLREAFDVPLMQLSANPDSVRRIVKTTLVHLGSVYWHVIAGRTSFPVQVATEMRIPLIIWGGHQGVEQVGMYRHLDDVEMSRRYRKEHDLMGFEADDILVPYSDLKERDIFQFRYPEDDDLLSQGTRGIYLSNYLRWDPMEQHRQMVHLYEFKPTKLPRTFDPYDHVDCLVYMGYHDWLKQVKHGYSKVFDHATREIRHGRMSRSQGLAIAHEKSKERVPWLSQLANWLGSSAEGLQFCADRHRNRNHWQQIEPMNWDHCSEAVQIAETVPDEVWNSSSGRHLDDPYDSEFITYARGFPF